MLHLSTKGSKKSYAAKAACLTAGLVAVFASSSVFAAMTMKCPVGYHVDVVAAAATGAQTYQCRIDIIGAVAANKPEYVNGVLR